MHASTEQLLSLRDGAPVEAGLRQHVDGCASCGERLAELTDLRDGLRALPVFEAPEGVWERIEAGLDRGRARSVWWMGGVAAATALVVLAVWRPFGDPQRDTIAANDGPAATLTLADRSPAGDEPGLDKLVTESRQLERLLRELDTSTPKVMNAGTADTIAGLQDGIAFIDYGLSRNAQLSRMQSEELWRQRVELMNTLVQVRGAQVQQVSNLRR